MKINLKLNIIGYNKFIYIIILVFGSFVAACVPIDAGLNVNEQIGVAGVSLSFAVLAAPAQYPTPSFNYNRRTSYADGKVATLVAMAHIHRISQHDGEMAASKRSVYLAWSVAAKITLASERAPRQAARGCRGQ